MTLNAGYYTYLVHLDLNRGQFVAAVLEFPYLLAFGGSADEALQRATEAVQEKLDALGPDAEGPEPLNMSFWVAFTVVSNRPSWATYRGNWIEEQGQAEFNTYQCQDGPAVHSVLFQELIKDQTHKTDAALQVFAGCDLAEYFDLEGLRQKAAVQRRAQEQSALEQRQRREAARRKTEQDAAEQAERLELDRLKAKYEKSQ